MGTNFVDGPPPYRLLREGQIIESYGSAEAVLKDWQLGDVVYDADDRMLTSREQLETLVNHDKI